MYRLMIGMILSVILVTLLTPAFSDFSVGVRLILCFLTGFSIQAAIDMVYYTYRLRQEKK